MINIENNGVNKGLIYFNVIVYFIFVFFIINGLFEKDFSNKPANNITIYILYFTLSALIIFVCYLLLANNKYAISWAININFMIAFLIIGLKSLSYILLIDSINDFNYIYFLDKETIFIFITGIILIFLSFYYKYG